jgi:hypothetical protein
MGVIEKAARFVPPFFAKGNPATMIGLSGKPTVKT